MAITCSSKSADTSSKAGTIVSRQDSVQLAYLISRYPAISHTFILREIRRLRQLGFAIDIASMGTPDRPDQELAQEEREEKAVTFYVKPQGWRGALAAHWKTLLERPGDYFRGLAYAIRLAGLDLGKIVYFILYFVEAVIVGRWMLSKQNTHLHTHFTSTVGLITSKIFPITLSITVHGPDEFYDVPGYRLMDKVCGASFILTISHFGRSQLMKVSPPTEWDKIEVTRLGVDPGVFLPRPFREQPDPFEIICVGRLVPAKGQHILLFAIAKLAAQGRNVFLRLVGDGPDRASLEGWVRKLGLEKQVRFEGNVNQDHIRDLYGRADAFVMASFAEGIAIVLMEAMSMEIPCVTTFITGHPELISDGENGFLVAPSDDEALMRVIGKLMDDPALRRRVGEAGRRRVDEAYNIHRNTEYLGEVLRKRLALLRNEHD